MWADIKIVLAKESWWEAQISLRRTSLNTMCFHLKVPRNKTPLNNNTQQPKVQTPRRLRAEHPSSSWFDALSKDTDVAPEVVAQASSNQVVGILLLSQTVQGQALHRQRLWRKTKVQQTHKRGRSHQQRQTWLFLYERPSRTSMLGKLGVGQDLFAELQPVSVLLVFVTSLSKEARSHWGQENKIRNS